MSMQFLMVLPMLSVLVFASASTPLSAATETGSTEQPLAKSVASTVQPADQAIAQDTAPVTGLKATINEIPTQLVMYLFQVNVTVTDAAGRPAEGKQVSVRLSPNVGGHFLKGRAGDVTLRAATGLIVDSLNATTNNEGVASVLLKISSPGTPKKLQLIATVGDAPDSFTSNAFQLYSPENYQEY